jgi:hypothetical protein
VDHTKDRQRGDPGHGNIVGRQNAKASPRVEAAQTDAAILRIFVKQKPTNKKAADGEEDVDSDVPVSRQSHEQRVTLEEADSTVVQNDANDRQSTPTIESGDVPFLVSHVTSTRKCAAGLATLPLSVRTRRRGSKRLVRHRYADGVRHLVTKAENRWGNGASKKTTLLTNAFKANCEADAFIGVLPKMIFPLAHDLPEGLLPFR